MKNLKLGLFLGVIAALSGLCMSLINGVTEPIIKENLIAAEKANLELMYPGANFAAVEKYNDESGLIQGVYEVEGKGYVFKLSGFGYSSTEIIFLAGFDSNGVVEDIISIQNAETSGIGSKAFEADYINTLKGAGADKDFDLISGASKTSGAIVRGLNAARIVLAEIK